VIREHKPTAPLRPCTGCNKHPLLCHDNRKGGTWFVECPVRRCNVRTPHFPEQERAEGNWGYESTRTVLRLRQA
jgi:hypothetical protein